MEGPGRTDRAGLADDNFRDRQPELAARAVAQKRLLHDKLIEHKLYIARYGDDMLEIRDGKWS